MKSSALKSPIHLNKCIIIGTSLFLGLLILNELLSSFPIVSFIILFSTGWLFWTFVEYFIHRFLMHELILPGSKDTIFNHQKHHQNPQSLKVRPIHRIIFLLILLLAIWLSVINGGYTPILSGFVFGFTIYNYLHYILHRPIGKYILPNVQRAHILHHYNRPNHGFSFSTSLWDWLFRTQPPKEDMITESMLKKYFLNSKDIS